MQSLPKNKNKQIKKSNLKLICITGYPSSGKTTIINYLKELGYLIFNTDKFVHESYKSNNIGYQIIKNYFGNEYVNEIEVDRKKLKQLILSDDKQKAILDKVMGEVIYKKILDLKQLNKIIFIELGIYIYNPNQYQYLFDKVIVVKNLYQKELKNDFEKFIKFKKITTKCVGNSKNEHFSSVFYADYIVKNSGNLADLKLATKKMLRYLNC